MGRDSGSRNFPDRSISWGNTPLDCLARNLKTGELRPDDLVSIPNVGAYGLTASVIGFLSRPVPLEIVCRGNEVESVHRLRSGHEQTDDLSPQSAKTGLEIRIGEAVPVVV